MSFGCSSGFWSIESEKDPRWNASGEEQFLSVMSMPTAAKEHLKECEKLYGERPDDLEYFCIKD